MKKYIVTIFSLLMCILIAQDAKTYLAQADLEDKIQSKVTTALSKMFDNDKFFVWARVELSKKQSSMDSDREEQEEKTMESNKDPFGYDVFEGLGLTGLSTLPSVPNVIMPGESSPAIESSYSFGDYDLKRIAVSIYISESIYDINARKTITNFINDEFPQIRDCFDCFKLETMPDKGNSSNESNLEIAFKELKDSLRVSVINHERNLAGEKLNLLTMQLDEANAARLHYENEESLRKELERNLDSLQFTNLLEIEKEYRTKQNELLDNMTTDYESAIQSKTDMLEKTNDRLFDLLEQGSSGAEDVNGISASGTPLSLEPWGEGTSTSYVVIILVVVVVCLLVFMIFFRGKKKVVYLKPKKSPEATKPNTSSEVKNNTPEPTNLNDDIARAEIRTLRQSAVTMSAGQKEGATQIIKDWLDDSPSENNDEETNSDDKEE